MKGLVISSYNLEKFEQRKVVNGDVVIMGGVKVNANFLYKIKGSLTLESGAEIIANELVELVGLELGEGAVAYLNNLENLQGLVRLGENSVCYIQRVKELFNLNICKGGYCEAVALEKIYVDLVLNDCNNLYFNRLKFVGGIVYLRGKSGFHLLFDLLEYVGGIDLGYDCELSVFSLKKVNGVLKLWSGSVLNVSKKFGYVGKYENSYTGKIYFSKEDSNIEI